MCGIFAILHAKDGHSRKLRQMALMHSRKQQHRGPDWTRAFALNSSILVHDRLAIVDPESGTQPFTDSDGTIACAVNGEIYNCRELKDELDTAEMRREGFFTTRSDCEVILPCYLKYETACASKLDGQFAFVISAEDGSFYAARDPIGISPMYWGHDSEGRVYFSSEMKCLENICTSFDIFPPGHWINNERYEAGVGPQQYASVPSAFGVSCSNCPSLLPMAVKTNVETWTAHARECLIKAVEHRLMSDVPWGVLLSGGLDSSLVAALAVRAVRRRGQEALRLKGTACMTKVHTFTIGLEGSPDLAAARKVADFLGTEHHEYTFTVQEGLDVMDSVVYHTETYDVTTIRASTPMYLMARKIKSLGIKMVLSGEGADEALAGYLYFHKAPNRVELHRETVKKMQQLHLTDCLRANKSLLAFGVEGRFPFLDSRFLEAVFEVDPTLKMSGTHPAEKRIEKHWLRTMFDDKVDPLLPSSVLWRQKEQFSDGVGMSWIKSLKATADLVIGNRELKAAPYTFPINPPKSKEAMLIRKSFAQQFPSDAAARTVLFVPSVACSTPDIMHWDPAFALIAKKGGEQSGAAVKDVHWSGKEGETGESTGEEVRPEHQEIQ